VNTHRHHLVRITIVGGFLDGQSFDFATPMNCLIGARGTGKTTVLEFTRWTMDAMPGDPVERRRIEELVARNLKGGRVDLTVRTRDGLAYTVSRSPGDDPIVKTAEGKVTDLTVAGGGLFRISVFSQNEVEQIADRSASQLDLLDCFEPEQIAGFSHQMEAAKHQLELNASRLKPLREQSLQLTEELKGSDAVDERLRAFGGEGGDSADAINQAHAAKALRDREVRSIKGAKDLVAESGKGVKTLVGIMAGRSHRLVTDEMRSGQNAGHMGDLATELADAAQAVDRHLEAALARLNDCWQRVSILDGSITQAHREQEVAFQHLIESHKEAQEKASERSRLEKMRNELHAKAAELGQIHEQITALETERQQVMDQLSELRDQRFAVRKAIAKRINDQVGPAIRVKIAQHGDNEQYRDLVESALRGTGCQPGPTAKKVASSIAPQRLAACIRAKDRGSLRTTASLNDNQIARLLDQFSDEERLGALEAVELADRPTIELNDKGSYKETANLSTGQKCTAVLPILLINSDSPLLIDQPEDNLDNRFVFEHIVHSIRKVKQVRQLIFVTHNPNIPVLGEAERVVVLDSDGMAARVRNAGTVDQCKSDIVTLLEGGEDAFAKRAQRYAAP
jgi:hypothetical protein